jgi:hypothetical protein
VEHNCLDRTISQAVVADDTSRCNPRLVSLGGETLISPSADNLSHKSASAGLRRVLISVAAHTAIHAEVFDNSSNEELQKFLVGKKISAAGRKGKQMWLEFEGESRALLLHFGERTDIAGSAKFEATVMLSNFLCRFESVKVLQAHPSCGRHAAGMTGSLKVEGVDSVTYVR